MNPSQNAKASKLLAVIHSYLRSPRFAACFEGTVILCAPLTNKKSEVQADAKTRKAIAVIAIVSASTLPLPRASKRSASFCRDINEVPAVSTTGNGTFNARISNDESQIDWELSYTDLEGAIQQAHIHIGNTGVNGGITVFLCTNLGNGPAGIQPCPAPPATISGTILAADVSPNIPATLAARNQGLGTGEIDELINAIRAGATYVNVHSTTWPGGEIRSQIDGNSSHNH